MAICSLGFEPSKSTRKAWIVQSLLVGAAVAAAAVVARRCSFRRLIGLGGYRRRVVGIIPARFASSRFQGKPLVNILGKPMIQRTWEKAMMASTLDRVVVATDDERIANCCLGFGADVIMTSEDCKNGTERCYEALEKLGKNYDVVVNIQGDEPLIEPEIIDGIVKALQESPDAVFSTAVTSLKPEDGIDPNRVKCIVDNNGYAIYFSRGLIPYNKSGKYNPQFPYLLHLGIQSFDAKFLKIYPKIAPTPLQLEEDLEQLKVLENGYKMKISWNPNDRQPRHGGVRAVPLTEAGALPSFHFVVRPAVNWQIYSLWGLCDDLLPFCPTSLPTIFGLAGGIGEESWGAKYV